MKPGDKVVCINDTSDDLSAWAFDILGIEPPVRGRVYVVRSVFSCSFTGRTVLHLVGIVLPDHAETRREMGFLADHFRPLDEMKAEAAASEVRSTVGAV